MMCTAEYLQYLTLPAFLFKCLWPVNPTRLLGGGEYILQFYLFCVMPGGLCTIAGKGRRFVWGVWMGEEVWREIARVVLDSKGTYPPFTLSLDCTLRLQSGRLALHPLHSPQIISARLLCCKVPLAHLPETQEWGCQVTLSRRPNS